VLTRALHWSQAELDKSSPRLPTLFKKINFNITLLFASRSFKWYLPFRFSNQKLYVFRICTKCCTCPVQCIILDLFILIYRVSHKSRAIGELSYLQNMKKCKEGKAVANHVFTVSSDRILYPVRAVTALHS
jgi:hypothetical protein